MIIDAHVHVDWKDRHALDYARLNRIEHSEKALLADLRKNGVSAAVIIAEPFNGQNAAAKKAAARIGNGSAWIATFEQLTLDALGWPNPEMGDITRAVKQGASGVKIYLGYWHVDPTDPSLNPVYELCEKKKIPVLFHTGDTATKTGMLKYSHPLEIDDLAVNWPRLKIVMCHAGNPWFDHTKEILYKNENVTADLSGLVNALAKYRTEHVRVIVKDVNDMIHYIGTAENKFMFGADRPFSKIDESLDIVRQLAVDEEDRENILWRNAAKFFGMKTKKK
jgi:predicted TIM-barrel fold metal-dependent hydrolase